MDLNKINVECSDPMVYTKTNKRRHEGDLEKKHLKTKYKPFKIPPKPKIDERKMFKFK